MVGGLGGGGTICASPTRFAQVIHRLYVDGGVPMSFLDIFRHERRLRDLEDGQEKLRRDLNGTMLDAAAIFEKTQRMHQRIVKRAQIEEQNERAEVEQPAERQGRMPLTQTQIEVQREINRRRSGA